MYIYTYIYIWVKKCHKGRNKYDGIEIEMVVIWGSSMFMEVPP
jgi:hypothetical protein